MLLSQQMMLLSGGERLLESLALFSECLFSRSVAHALMFTHELSPYVV